WTRPPLREWRQEPIPLPPASRRARNPPPASACCTASKGRLATDVEPPTRINVIHEDSMLSLHRRSLRAILLGASSLHLAATGAHAEPAPAPTEEAQEVEELVVQATRSGRRVQDEPIRVEVINREEIEEKI